MTLGAVDWRRFSRRHINIRLPFPFWVLNLCPFAAATFGLCKTDWAYALIRNVGVTRRKFDCHSRALPQGSLGIHAAGNILRDIPR